MANLFEKIVNDLTQKDPFVEYKFRKRDSMFLLKNGGKRQSIELDHWIDHSTSSLVIYAVYGVRFDILHKWFEKFSFNTLQDQRDWTSVAFSGNMLGQQDEFHFKLNKKGYQKDFENMLTTLIRCSDYVFSTYSSLPNFYMKEIQPILDGEAELPDVGANWVFIDLTLCKLVRPDNYHQLKNILLDRVEFMYNRGEPNIKEYYEQLDEILSYLENTELN